MRGESRPALQRTLVSTWNRRGLLACLLWPFSLLFSALVALRRSLYRTGFFTVQQVPALVIVVGNVVAGGAGKTPVVMALVQHLQKLGLRPGVVSRGYGRRTQDCREVLGNSPACDVGDEPALIKRATAVPVFVAHRRFDAASALLAQYPDTDVIVCDDGLQHYALHRDIEVCVFDDRGLGNGFMLPAGPLREKWPRPVDLLLHTGAHPAFAGFTAQRALARHAIRADGTRLELLKLAEPGTPPLLAVAAIAQPETFFAMLRAQGLNLVRTIALPDHHDFDGWRRPADKDYTLICTEKDAVKLWHSQPDALAVPLEFTPEPAFMASLDARLSARMRTKLSSAHGHQTS